jgi:hypothetical protein
MIMSGALVLLPMSRGKRRMTCREFPHHGEAMLRMGDGQPGGWFPTCRSGQRMSAPRSVALRVVGV